VPSLLIRSLVWTVPCLCLFSASAG
jgi:hypothetical protein